LFNSYIDAQLPVNYATVEALLVRVKEVIDAEPELRKMKVIFDEIKRLVNVEQDRDAVRAVSDLVKFGEDVGQIRVVKQAIGELTIWIERMYGLCGGGYIAAADLAFMKKKIEQVLRRKVQMRESVTGDPLSHGLGETSPSASYAFD
jgi:hypothetical protein